MDFNERLVALTGKIQSQREAIHTEEATKNAFVMPFISTVLGYDVFNPLEVIPEFTADVGLKKNEKVDYAVKRDGEVRILIECKRTSEPLRVDHASQLYRYFSVTNARIAILTNGEVYQFYTDLDAPNRMDEKPFLILDFNDIDEALVPQLRKLTKESFNLDSILSAAEELKYLSEIKRILSAQFREPQDDWIRFFATRVYGGAFTKRVREQFTPLVVKASAQFLTDQVNDRLKSALDPGRFQEVGTEEGGEDSDEEPEGDDEEGGDGIVTTLEEMEGYRIVKAIACSDVLPERVGYRDSKSYFAVLLDNNNRKTIARLHFNGRRKKHLGTFDAEKNETKHLLGSLDGIYEHAELIRATVRNFLE